MLAESLSVSPTPLTLDIEKRTAFAQFVAIHGRSYAARSEIDHRYNIFSQNYDSIHAHNNNAVKTFT